MSFQLITTQDLQNLKEEILSEIQVIFGKYARPPYTVLLKSDEVIKLLKVSAGTLRKLRCNGTLKFIKKGKIIYYDQDHVQQILVNSMGEAGS